MMCLNKYLVLFFKHDHMPYLFFTSSVTDKYHNFATLDLTFKAEALCLVNHVYNSLNNTQSKSNDLANNNNVVL